MEWREITGYEGLYSISDTGEVHSTARPTTPGGILKRQKNSCGYSTVMLCKNGKAKCFCIHTLVARAFIGPRPEGHEINHKDGNKANPSLDNLEYVTPSQNMLHSRNVLKNRGGIFRGMEQKTAKLTDDQVRQIRSLINTMSQISIAHKFGVCRDTIRKVTSRTYWKHI